MRIIHLRAPPAHKAEEAAGILIAMTPAIFGEAERKIAVTLRPSTIYLVMKGAIHRFDVVIFVLNLYRRIHAFLIQRQMTRSIEKLFFGNDRSCHSLVAPLRLGFFRPIFKLFFDDVTFRKPDGKALADRFIEMKKI